MPRRPPARGCAGRGRQGPDRARAPARRPAARPGRRRRAPARRPSARLRRRTVRCRGGLQVRGRAPRRARWAASSAVWCSPVSRSPAASRTRSKPAWKASCSRKWSYSPAPVATRTRLAPSRARRTRMRVSAVARAWRTLLPDDPATGGGRSRARAMPSRSRSSSSGSRTEARIPSEKARTTSPERRSVAPERLRVVDRDEEEVRARGERLEPERAKATGEPLALLDLRRDVRRVGEGLRGRALRTAWRSAPATGGGSARRRSRRRRGRTPARPPASPNAFENVRMTTIPSSISPAAVSPAYS